MPTEATTMIPVTTALLPFFFRGVGRALPELGVVGKERDVGTRRCGEAAGASAAPIIEDGVACGAACGAACGGAAACGGVIVGAAARCGAAPGAGCGAGAPAGARIWSPLAWGAGAGAGDSGFGAGGVAGA